MNNDNEEIELLDFLNSLSSLAWRKFQKKRVQLWRGGKLEVADCSAFPPFFSFRFRTENSELIQKLRLAVSSYEGQVSWILAEHKRIGLPGTNFIICPTEYWKIKEKDEGESVSVGERMANENPLFGLSARSDIGKLKEHLKKNLIQ